MKAALMFRDLNSPVDHMLEAIMACSSTAELQQRYPIEQDASTTQVFPGIQNSTAAFRLFEFLKDNDSIFTSIRKLCGLKQLIEVAKLHVRSPFPNAQAAGDYIKQHYRPPTRKLQHGLGSSGKLVVENYWETLISFVDGPCCQTEADIFTKYVGKEREDAIRIFEALKSKASQFNFFVELRSDPMRHEIATQHATKAFINGDEVRTFLEKLRKTHSLSPSGRGTGYISFSPTGSKSGSSFGDDEVAELLNATTPRFTSS